LAGLSPISGVSTDKQGQSGLGLEAQRQAVMNYLNGGTWKLVAEHTELESGKRNACRAPRIFGTITILVNNAGVAACRPRG
jgi:NAD(P)-dependent dehydrogenase (short-subunit alcohol dehydrogenase family)